ncbi:hypothetical protein M6B38_181110 [Iris pallida]|uniref:Uncharacterized protein n=1 Tax=Iris pallida TaxID=29817 RepID=A0AAX6EMW9_IRIPA|nr:hypothetical protein M6B38_181110 [Iris pallida]
MATATWSPASSPRSISRRDHSIDDDSVPPCTFTLRAAILVPSKISSASPDLGI